MADDNLQSWMYWSFKSYNDVTTINNGLQALYQAGTLSMKKLEVLQRNYAPIVAGKLTRMKTNEDGRLSLEVDFEFTADQVDQDDMSSQSQSYFAGSHESHVYGVRFSVEPAEAVKVLSCEGNYIILVNSEQALVDESVSVSLRFEECTAEDSGCECAKFTN